MMRVRGIRGATTVKHNTEQEIISATRTLLEKLIEENDIAEDDVASVLFTTTPELTAAFPAKAAREMGWSQVALMGAAEIAAMNGIPMCIRVLIHWNTEKGLDEIVHVYMRGAEVLRKDLYPDHRVYVKNGEDESK
ncbi:MAG: chorismate mutase [Chloroflexota bacterium]